MPPQQQQINNNGWPVGAGFDYAQIYIAHTAGNNLGAI
jgi:hypothetical protein